MKIGRFFAPALLGVLIAAAYGASLRNDFVHDDGLFMEDPRVQSAAQMPRLLYEPRWGFEKNRSPLRLHQYYRPLEPLPYIASHFLGGGRPAASHLVCLFLHWLNSLIVLLLLRRWVGAGWPSLFGAALFAVYPAYSEAVLWPAALGGLGVFACTWTIFQLNVGVRWRWWRWPLSVLLYLAALLFKETGVLAPLFAALGWLLLDRAGTGAGVMALRLTAFVPALLSYAVLRDAALGRVVPRLDYLPFSWFEMGLNALAQVPHYVSSLAWPLGSSFHHDFEPVRDIFDGSVWLGLLYAVVAVLAVVWLRRRRPVLAFGIAATGLAALPYVILHKPADNVFAERYLYDMAAGIALVVASLGLMTVRRGSVWRVVAVSIAVTLLVIFIIADRHRTGEWRDEVTLFSRTLRQAERAEIVRVNLGVRLLRLGRHEEGIAVLEDLQRIDAEYRGASYNLGLLYHAVGRRAEAVRAMEKAAQRDPFNPTALLNLAYFYDRIERRDDAVTTYFHLLAIDDEHTGAWYNLAVIAYEEGQVENARAALGRVLARAPDDAPALALSRRLDSSRQGAPRRPEVTLRRCQAGKEAAQAGRGREAVARLRAAAWLDEAAPLPHQYLANVYAISGNRNGALHHQEEALRRDPDNQLYKKNMAALRAAMNSTSQVSDSKAE
jgi:tetratricopeptide (TPR) repeat protein